MSGLSRFDFYPRDWHLDTRDLGNAAKGVYIDLLASMYARGGPIPADERELCRICGCATARSLRPLVAELINKGKLKLENGHLTNGRSMEEIAKFERRRAISSKGGKARSEAQPETVRPEFEPNSTRTQPETRTDIEENQRDNLCPPSPSPSQVSIPPTEGAETSPSADPKKPLYDLGRSLIGPKSGGQVTNLIRLHGGDLDATMQTMQLAARKSDPREYIGAILAGNRQPETDWDAEYRRMGVSA
jgi:uncharacterized protein YdaU (DUF1376 family)